MPLHPPCDRTFHRPTAGLKALCAAALTALLALAGCGGGGGGGGTATDAAATGAAGSAAPAPAPVQPAANPPDYFPMAVGDRWIYADSVNGAAPLQTAFRVIGTQDVGGVAGLVARADDSGTTRQEIYLRTTQGISRAPAASADAVTQAIGPVLVMRLPVQPGDSYTAVDKNIAACYDFDSDGVLDPLTVQSRTTVVGFESLDTAVGSLTGVAHLRTVLTQSTTLSGNGAVVTVRVTTDDWYAPGLGPVRRLTVTEATGTTERSDRVVQVLRVGGVPSDSVPPTLASVAPADGSTQAPSVVLQAVYSEAMDRTVTGVLQLTAPDGSRLAADLVWDDDWTVRLVPQAPLAAGRYTASATTAAQDLAGNALAAARVWSFTVAPAGP